MMMGVMRTEAALSKGGGPGGMARLSVASAPSELLLHSAAAGRLLQHAHGLDWQSRRRRVLNDLCTVVCTTAS